MTFIPGLNPIDSTPDQEDAVAEYLSKDGRKRIKQAIEGIVDDEYDRFEEQTNHLISQCAADRATLFLERVLSGDEDAALSLINMHGDGRYRMYGVNKDKPWAHLIHGKLFESKSVRVRREIVEAHRDLITDERIKDLEATVEGLRLQVLELKADKRRLEEMVRL